MDFPKSNAVRVSLLLVMVLFWLLGNTSAQAGLPIWFSFLEVVALAVTASFGLWGIAAVVIGTALHETRGSLLLVVPALVLFAARLGVMLWVIRRMMPVPTREGLVRTIPVVVLLNYGLWLLAMFLRLSLVGHPEGMIRLSISSLVASPILQLLFAFILGIPAYRWIEAKGGFDAVGAQLVSTTSNTLKEALKSPPDLAGQTPAQPGSPGTDKPVARASRPAGYAVADYGVPYCDYQETEEGFIVRFNKTHVGFHRAASSVPTNGGAAQALGGLVALSAIGVAWAAHKAAGGTTIEVTREAVIIDGTAMHRDDFGGFNVDHTFKGSSTPDAVATLGYTFGHRSFAFGGTWPEKQATEIASALNHLLRRLPRAGDEGRASPDALRNARPTDF